MKRHTIESVSDFNARALANMKKTDTGQVRYACGCGSSKFELHQDSNNIKAVCVKCNDYRIIAWNTTGAVLSLDTLKWKKPELTLTMK